MYEAHVHVPLGKITSDQNALDISKADMKLAVYTYNSDLLHCGGRSLKRELADHCAEKFSGTSKGILKQLLRGERPAIE